MVLQCAYGRGDNDVTCLNNEELKQMQKVKSSKPKKDIYKELLTQYKAKNDIDLIKKYNMENSGKKINMDDVLKPSTPGFYLSNEDIDKIFHQFVIKHPEFMSYGGVPLDFWKRPNGSWKKNCDKIYGFDIKKFVNGGKRKWGMVANLDESNSEGSHWVCMYFVVNEKTKKAKLEYFDSIGTNECRSMVECTNQNIPKEIMKFIDIVKKNCEDNGYSFEFTFNKKQHQRGNNECGMYCIYYILNRIKNVPYSDISNIPDEKMTYLRNVLFKSPHYCWKCKKYKRSIEPLLKKHGK